MGVVESFRDLFEGRKDVYGTEEGGCRRDDGTVDVWGGHLMGSRPIGVYPMVFSNYGKDPYDPMPTWRVKWGCIDFDVKTKGKPSWDYETESDAHIAAVNVQKVLKHLGITSWLERTRSYGRHVWVFSRTWVSAEAMRKCLLFASSIAGTTTREVNPKQTELAEGQVGNYVRLPYAGWFNRPIIDSEGVPFPLEIFLGFAQQHRTPADTIIKVAERYTEPVTPKPTLALSWDGPLDGPVRRLNNPGFVVWRDGPDDGDRSKGMAYLAYQCKLSGLTQGEAYGVLRDCGWNKYAGRNDEDIRLNELIAGAWQ